jgi:probable RNA-binding protein EIF1AD
LYPSNKGEEQMKAGRKNLRRACDEGAAVTLAEGESIMQVLTLRGSNVIEVRRLLRCFPGLPGSVAHRLD